MNGTGTRGADTLREMWETRPYRPREGRKIAGVAAAIGRRYDVDPVLLRVAFVVTAFAGIGFWLYLAAALVLPGEQAENEGRRTLRPHAVVGLAVLGFIVVSSTVWGRDRDGDWGLGWGLGAIASGAVALGLLFLLHRSRAQQPTPTPPAAAEPTRVSLVKGAPTWDPLGAAPFAWDLPEPSAPPPPPAPRQPPVTAVTLALALLAGGATGLLMLALGGIGPVGAPVLLGVVLAVLGAGLLVGSFLHAGRGLVPVAAIVGLVTWGTLAAPWVDGPGRPDYDISPTTPAQLEPTYRFGGGDVDMDLSRLDLAVGPDGATDPVRTSVDVGAGDVRVTVPEDADVSVVLEAGWGRVAFEDQEWNGEDADLTVRRDLGEDGVASGRPLEITVRAGVGEVEVQRD